MAVQDLGLQASLAGLVLGLSFIFSLGPQNLRLLRAGTTNSHALTVASVGYLSEVSIVLFGVTGMSTTLVAVPAVAGTLQAFGIGFLVWCALRAFKRRVRCRETASEPGAAETRTAAVLSMLSVTWLNPLVYLEVMFLVGVLASSYDDRERTWFATGYLIAAAVRIYGWSLVGRIVSPWLSTPRRQMQFEAASGSFLLLAAVLLALQLSRALAM